MDADSSYGGSDTAQDSTLGHDNNSLETTIPNHTESVHDHHDSSSHHDEVKSVNSPDDSNTYYKNEITLPVNYEEGDSDKSSLPHYLSTAKLTIEESLENHHNLDELSKNYSSTHNLNAETPKSRKKSTAGIDNPAYQEDETKPPTTNGALKSTFDEKKTYNNGDLNSSASLGFTSPTKNDEPLSEAVNLELINLKPTGKDVVGPYENGNGISDIPVKKETEVEIGNPYDEYFVPVNEHRKYMSSTRKGRNSVTFAESVASAGVDDTGLSLTTPERGILEYPDWLTALENPRGEKLYLTKDKRDTKKRNRCLCWSLLLAIVVAAVIVGILAAVGIIGNQEPEPIHEARNFGGSASPNDIKTGGGFFGISEEGISETKTPSRTGSYPVTPEPPISTVSNLLPTTDTSMIEVPRALESQLKIDNLPFTAELLNANSTEYRNLAAILENELKSALFTNDVLNYGAANIELKVTEFLPGSIIVKYRIGWEFKDGIHNANDPINPDTLKSKLQSTLTRNNGYIYEYHIREDTVDATKIMNLCLIENNGCEHTCSFDYKLVNFVCSCPSQQHLDLDGKKCINEPQAEPEPVTEPDVVDFEFENVHTPVKPEVNPIPEPTTLPEVEVEPTAEPTALPEPEPTIKPEPKPEPEATAEPTAQPEPTVQPEPKPEPEPTAEPTVQPEPTAEPTVQPAPQQSTQSEQLPTAEPTPEPVPKSEPEPATTSEINVETHTTNNIDHENIVHSYMTTSEPTILQGREGKFDDSQHNIYVEHITVVDPTSVPVLTTEHTLEAEPATKPEPTGKPQPEPTLEPEVVTERAAQTELQPNVIAEPEPTAVPEPTAQPEPTALPEPQPTTQSRPQLVLTAEFAPTIEPEHAAEPEPTTAEPEPTAEPIAKLEPTIEPKPATEPEPTAEPELNTQSDLTTTWKPSLSSSSSTESNASVVNETTNKQPKIDEGHIFIIPPAAKHTTPVPELTTLSQEYFSGSDPNIQLLTFNDSAVNTTDKTTESETTTTSFKTGNEVLFPEKTTLKSEIEQQTSESFSEHLNFDNTTTANPEQSTHEKLEVNIVVPLEDSSEATTSNLQYLLKDRTTQKNERESESPQEVSTIASVDVPVKETTLKPEDQLKLLQVPASENNNVTNSENIIHPIIEDGAVNKSETDTVTTNFEQATEIAYKQNNWIPFELNSKNEMIKTETTTSVNNNETSSVINQHVLPVVINNETHLINMENSTLSAYINPKEYETTTIQQSTPEIASSEITRSRDIQDHSTENIVPHTTHETHQHMVTYDATETTNVLDNMSPFLPEIENDTLVKILHSDGDHYTDMHFHHNDTDMHDEHALLHVPEKPPRLDNDEMNVTNPHDPNPTDTTLGVIPFEEDKTEKFNEILSSLEVTTRKEVAAMNNEGRQLSDVTDKERDNITEMTTMPEKEQTTTNVVMETSTPVKEADAIPKTNIATSSNMEYITTSPRNIEPTLNPDILNNIHSNNFFFKLQTSTESAGHTEMSQTTSAQPEQNTTVDVNTEIIEKAQENTTSRENFTDINTSTEDLVALETTTNKLGDLKEPILPALTTESTTLIRNASTIYAEIVDTATETVHFGENNNSVDTTVRPETINVTENNSTMVTLLQNETIETTTESAKMAERTRQYEVHETISEDLTTTKSNILKLFTTTERSIKTLIESGDGKENEAENPLSVIQLSEQDVHSKQDRKRVPDESYNKFDPIDSLYDPNDFLNDISDEEKSVLEKFDVDHILNKQKENEKLIPKSTSETKLDIEHEKDHYLATDFTDKATFTATPSKKHYLENSEKELYGKTYYPEKTIVETRHEEIELKRKNTTEPISLEAVKPVTEGFTISGFSRCAAGQFQCRNGTSIKDKSYCIPSNDQCDSTDDCTDASDEAGCAEEKCRDNFQCASGQCLKRNLVCDGIANCNDRTDEQNCESWKCSFDEFSCGNGGRCIPLSWKCDGHAHCPGAEDEFHCHAETCNNNAYHCIEQGTCIRASLRCDGKQDCAGGDDENLCECAVDQFKCKLGGGCIPMEQQCDGMEQCADFSDEWNCLRLQESSENVTTSNYLEVLSANQTWLQICSDSWNNSYSDLACQSLGYAGATSTESLKMLENSTNEFYKLKPLQQYGVHLLSQLEKTNSCDSVVSVTCQEFVCGSHTSLDVQSARIIGGSSAADTQWPSVTLLYNKKYNKQCTATLIAPLWVIASYSCVLATDTLSSSSSSNEWILYAGGTNFFNNVDNSTTQVRPVKNIIIHPQEKYSQFVFKYDMVLVELASPLMLRQNVAAICLPNKDIEPRQLCVTAGWGISRPGDSNTQQYLHYLPVPTIDMEECNSTKHYNGRVPDDKICAGYTDSDKTPCYNDEGAPLMCFSDSAGTWELHGLLAYHSNCGRNHHPALYSSINKDTREWITNTIGMKAVTNQRLALNKE